MSNAGEFYDGLADEYDCLFADWWSAARWHGSVIGALLAAEGVRAPATVLDCTCGIGTQALPLAAMGYRVTATDLSAGAVARARAEAAQRGISADMAVADMRAVREVVQGQFDAAISCDNALPHLLTDADLLTAMRSVRACLRPDGLFLASIRDYDALAAARQPGVPIAMHGQPGARHASGQAWSWWESADYVDIALFTMTESAAGWKVTAHETTYRALRRADVTAALRRSGYDEPRWLEPDESGYYQPVVLARASPATEPTGRRR